MKIRHQRVLSDEQIRDYHETGYLNIRQILDSALLARLIATTERLYDEGRSLQQRPNITIWNLSTLSRIRAFGEFPALPNWIRCTLKPLSIRFWVTSLQI